EGIRQVEWIAGDGFDLRRRVCLRHICLVLVDWIMRVACRMAAARFPGVPGAASRALARLAKPLAITALASLRVSPASRVSQHSNSRTVGSCRVFTVSTRASGSMG